MLTFFDYLLITIYFIIVLIVGWFAGKKETKEEYLISGRNLSFFDAATTIFASKIGAGILLTYTALVYLYGLGALWYFIGAIFGYLVFYFFAKKIKKLSDEKQYYTLPDFFFDQKGKLTGYLVSVVVFLSMFGWVIVNFTGGAKVISEYSVLSFELSIILMGIVILTYLLVGGFKAVVKTDVIQAFGISLLFILMLFLLFTSGNSLASADFNLFSIPVGQIVNFFLAGLLFPLASAELWQRVYAVKDGKELKKSLILASSLYFVVGVVLLFIGLVIRTKLSDLDADTSLIVGFGNLLPTGLTGLAIVVFYSAIMSSADTYLFTSNSSLTQDFLQKSGYIKKENVLKVMKISMALLMILGVILSLLIRDIVDTTFFFVALMMSLGFITLVIWIKPKINKHAINFAIIFSLIGVVVLAIIQGISTSLVSCSLVLSVLGLLVGSVFNLVKDRVGTSISHHEKE